MNLYIDKFDNIVQLISFFIISIAVYISVVMEIPASRANAHAYLLHLISSIDLRRETKMNDPYGDAVVKSIPGSMRCAEESIDAGSTSGEDR